MSEGNSASPVLVPADAGDVFLPLGTPGFPPGGRVPGWGPISTSGDVAATSHTPTDTPPNVAWLTTNPIDPKPETLFWYFLPKIAVPQGTEDFAALFLPKPPPSQYWNWQAVDSSPGYPIFYTTGGTQANNSGPGGSSDAAPIGTRWIKAPAGTGVPAVLLYDGSDDGIPHKLNDGTTSLIGGADAFGISSADVLDPSNPPTPPAGYQLPIETYSFNGPGGFYSADNSNGPLPSGFNWTVTGSGFTIGTLAGFSELLSGVAQIFDQIGDDFASGKIGAGLEGILGVLAETVPITAAAGWGNDLVEDAGVKGGAGLAVLNTAAATATLTVAIGQAAQGSLKGNLAPSVAALSDIGQDFNSPAVQKAASDVDQVLGGGDSESEPATAPPATTQLTSNEDFLIGGALGLALWVLS